MQNCGGHIRCIMGDLQVAYGAFVYRNREERACPLGPFLTTFRVGPFLG